MKDTSTNQLKSVIISIDYVSFDDSDINEVRMTLTDTLVERADETVEW